MKINAKIIADSRNDLGHRITSMVLTYPRYIHSEVMTHRVFSRNAASSRAIPFNEPEKAIDMVREVRNNPFIPVAWQKGHKGMQGFEYHTDPTTIDYLTKQWLFAKDCAIDAMLRVDSNDVTKQITNRPLESYMWYRAIVTSTEWENFFKLRCPQYHFEGGVFRSKKDALVQIRKILGESDFENTDDYYLWASLNKGQAEIHLMMLAESMWDAMNDSLPQQVPAGQWHIPFGDKFDDERISDTLYHLGQNKILVNNFDLEQAKIEIATARCARVSYLNYEGKDDYEADFRLFKQLKDSEHASPFEHCAKAMDIDDLDNNIVIENGITYPGRCRNFTGFIQLRASSGL